MTRGELSNEKSMDLDTADQIVDEHLAREAGNHDPSHTEELSTSRLFLLFPTGRPGSASWDAWPVADSRLPETARVQAILAEATRRMNESDERLGESGEDLAILEWDEFVRNYAIMPTDQETLAVRGRHSPVAPTTFIPFSTGLSDSSMLRGVEIRGPVDFGIDLVTLEGDAEGETRRYIAAVATFLLEGNRYRHSGSGEHVVGLESLRRESFMNGQPAPEFESWHTEADIAKVSEHIEDAARDTAGWLSERVSRTLAAVMLDAPRAALSIASPSQRLARPAVEWRFHHNRVSTSSVGLRDLSRAEQAWAERAILESLYWHRRETFAPEASLARPAVYLLDEPEAALHRAAEAHMARSLVANASDPRNVIVAATHSPELLDAPEAHLIEVKRGAALSGRSLVHHLDFSDRTVLAELGLLPSDLLRWPRVILLVEGLHDEVLLDAFLGARLRDARVHVIPLRGGSKLPATVESRVLFEFTRAHLIGLVDNQRAAVLADTWASALEAAAQGDVEAATRIVLDGIGRSESEAVFITNWLTAALEKGLEGRISPYALELPDIIEYLPVDRLIPGANSWSALRDMHSAERLKAPARTARDFKAWLGARFAVTLNASMLRNAADGLPVPRDFERLMKQIEARSRDVASA